MSCASLTSRSAELAAVATRPLPIPTLLCCMWCSLVSDLGLEMCLR
jgi:hypothetical protein